MNNKTSETILPVTFILPDVEQLFDNVQPLNLQFYKNVTSENDLPLINHKSYSLTTYPEGLLIISKGHRIYFLTTTLENNLYKLVPGMWEYCRDKNAVQLSNVTLAFMEHIQGGIYGMANYQVYPANFVTIHGEHYYKVK
jgi:hypothetical protein